MSTLMASSRRNAGNAGLTMVGLSCYCFLLQLGLQNLYIACAHADHIVRLSTWVALAIAIAAVATLTVTAVLGRHISPRALARTSLATTGTLATLFVLWLLAAHQYHYPLTILLACTAGVDAAVLLPRWALALKGRPLADNLASLMAANLIALVVMTAYFVWVGQVIWFDLPNGPYQAVLWALLAFAFLGSCLTCPQPALPTDDGVQSVETPNNGKGTPRAAAWRNLVLDQGKLLVGLVIISFCASVNWEVNAMRYGNKLFTWFSLLNHEVLATSMSLNYLALATVICTLGLTLIATLRNRAHARTIVTVLAYTIGCAFFLPGLCGIRGVSTAGITLVATLLYSICSFAIIIDRNLITRVSIASLACTHCIALLCGLVAGLAVSWVVAPHVYDNEYFSLSFAALSLFFSMTVPDFLFKPSAVAGTEAGEIDRGSGQTDAEDSDHIARRCRDLALQFGLSPREAEVMGLAAHGYTAPAIADSLMISENTVKVHMRHIYEKIGVHTKQELIRLAEGQ